jgi:hypothetical protein
MLPEIYLIIRETHSKVASLTSGCSLYKDDIQDALEVLYV